MSSPTADRRICVAAYMPSAGSSSGPPCSTIPVFVSGASLVNAASTASPCRCTTTFTSPTAALRNVVAASWPNGPKDLPSMVTRMSPVCTLPAAAPPSATSTTLMRCGPLSRTSVSPTSTFPAAAPSGWISVTSGGSVSSRDHSVRPMRVSSFGFVITAFCGSLSTIVHRNVSSSPALAPAGTVSAAR